MLDWQSFTNVLIVAAILCFLAVIILIVPAMFDYLRRWQENRRMYAAMQSGPESLNRAKRVIDAEDAHQEQEHALGWSERAAGADDSQEQGVQRFGFTPGAGKSVLVADDDPVVMLALSRRLQQLGFEVFRSPDAAHALLGAMKMRPDLIILDVNMPAGNGLAVCEMMASDPRYAGIPVVIHSVIADDATRQRCRQLGAHYVEKSPRSWAEIKSLVESLFGEGGKKPPQPTATEQSAAAPVCETASGDSSSADDARSVEATGGDSSSADDARLVEAAGGDSSSADDARSVEVASGDSSSADDARSVEITGGDSSSADDARSVEAAPPAPVSPVCGRPRVLCIEGADDQLELVDHQLSALGMEIFRTSNFEEGYWTCFTEKPQVIIVEAGGKIKPLLELLGRLAQHPVTRPIPVLLINEDGPEVADNLPAGGSVKVLKHPMDWEDLLGELETHFPMFNRGQWDPLTSDASAAPQSGRAADRPSDDAQPRPLKILCIDDDPVVARSIAIRLQPYGIKLLGAANGTQGYLTALTEKPDLILLDLKMPEGEGNYVMGKLKDSPQTKDIPVIILTIVTHPGVRRQMFAAGAEAYLNKPVRWPELFAEMERCIPLPKQLLVDYKLPGQLATSRPPPPGTPG